MTSIAAQRLARLGLGEGRASSNAIDAVRHLTAVQAQQWPAAQLTVRARAPHIIAADISDGLAQRELVVSWLNRGTLHLVTRDDYWLLQHATAAARIQTIRSRFQRDDVTADDIDSIASRVAAGLSEQPVSKAELVERMLIDRFTFAPGRKTIFAASILERLSATGDLVRAPGVDGDALYVSAQAWLGDAPVLNTTTVLSELARRYAAAHWPATADDFAAWLGIGRTPARAAWRAAELETSTVAAGPDASSWTGLLGPFDAALHGWPDREWLLGPYATRIISTNGIFRASVIVDSRCVGSWKIEHGQVALELCEPIPDDARRLIDADSRAIEAFNGSNPLRP